MGIRNKVFSGRGGGGQYHRPILLLPTDRQQTTYLGLNGSLKLIIRPLLLLLAQIKDYNVRGA